MKTTSQTSRITSLMVLLALALGVAAIDYHFCRDEPMGASQTSRLRRPSVELSATASKQGDRVAPADSSASL